MLPTYHAAFFDYGKDAREFSRSYMNLAEMKQLYERENKRVNVVKIWEQLDTGDTNGRNGLVKLAIWLLSIVANSAGSERGFSKFGIYLTKLRSQLSIQKYGGAGSGTGHEDGDSFSGLTTQLVKDLSDNRALRQTRKTTMMTTHLLFMHAPNTLKELFQYPVDATRKIWRMGLVFIGRAA
ncbi:hypothetical protein C8J57DRAFT_1252769 [Mycena rebaudengoi]|nr:hypothetical protein C8J57DRAFT_1252769 [Mycena rebaudengoi]